MAHKGVIIGPFGLEISSEVYIHPGMRLDGIARNSQGTHESDEKERTIVLRLLKPDHFPV